jgi:electron transfer flavoprotein alpha subunit
MEQILLLLTTGEDGTLEKATREAVTAARDLVCALGGSVWTVGLIGGSVQAAADRLAGCGAAGFLAVDGTEFAAGRYASDAAAAEALCRVTGAGLVLAPGTSRLMRALGGVAQRLGGAIDTHVVGLRVEDGTVRADRSYYRQRVEATLTRTHRPWILVLEPGSFPAWNGPSGTAAVKRMELELAPEARRTEVLGFQAAEAGEQTIRPDADLLFVAGAGWTKKQPDGRTHVEEAAELILEFVRRTKASLGSSKSLVDLAGEGQAVLPFLTHLHQVGQTGATPRHPKGLATCCHGEEPHVVGWRFISERRAINLDANCGWARGKADVLYVADAFDVLRAALRLLESDPRGAPQS